jgi:hypothetical protein
MSPTGLVRGSFVPGTTAAIGQGDTSVFTARVLEIMGVTGCPFSARRMAGTALPMADPASTSSHGISKITTPKALLSPAERHKPFYLGPRTFRRRPPSVASDPYRPVRIRWDNLEECFAGS